MKHMLITTIVAVPQRRVCSPIPYGLIDRDRRLDEKPISL